MRYLLTLVLLMLPTLALATNVTITIPTAFATSQKATDLCVFFAAGKGVDVQPTQTLCLQEIVRDALIEIQLDKIGADLREDIALDRRTQKDIIEGQWPTDLDLLVCGDGEPDTGEECDDGSTNSNTVVDACRTNCKNAFCGDGVTDTGEGCDPPFPTLCDPNCATIP